MKLHITIVSLFTFVSFAFGQTSVKKADQFFNALAYKEAAKAYEVSIEKGNESQQVLERLGDSYFFNTDMQSAYKWYDRLVSKYTDSIKPEYLFRYAHSLQGLGQHKTAKKWMKKFAMASKNEDIRVENYSQQKITIEDVLKLPEQFNLFNLSINTPLSDFGASYYGNRVVFASSNTTSKDSEEKYAWNKQPYLNLYVGSSNFDETDILESVEFSKEINSRYHEATVAFMPGLKKMFFTRNNYVKSLATDSEGVNHLKLYSAEIINNNNLEKWGNIKELPFNSDDYSVGHPTLNADGTKLYFASDMPGSIGATDIFVVDVLKDGNFSNPQNLGPMVNTSGREMFPFITDKALYFASDGHLGLGGLDVFESVKKENTFNKPQNLGAPLNSVLDDFAFVIDESESRGYISSNRKGGKGDDDIYSFERTDIEMVQCEQSIRGFVSNTITGERIFNAQVMLRDKKTNEILKVRTDINGKYAFDFIADCDTDYKVEVGKKGYKPKEKKFKTEDVSGETIVPIGIETLDKLIVEEAGVLKIKIGIIYFNLDKSFIRNDAEIELNKVVLLMSQFPKMEIKIESHTDARSNDAYNLSLSDRRAKSTKKYIVSQGIKASRIISAKGYGETRLINQCENGVKCSERDHQLNRRSEFVIVKM